MGTQGLVQKKATTVKTCKTNNITIEVDRDSVCMGDDCLSHRTTMFIPENMRLSELMRRLARYVPLMRNSIWAIRSDADICGYIITDPDGNNSFELCGVDKPVVIMDIHEIMCKYYYPSRFSWTDAKTGNRIEKYAECRTFLEKVKRDNE